MSHRVVSVKLHAEEWPEAVQNPQTSEPPPSGPCPALALPAGRPRAMTSSGSGLLSAPVSLQQLQRPHLISALSAGWGGPDSPWWPPPQAPQSTHYKSFANDIPEHANDILLRFFLEYKRPVQILCKEFLDPQMNSGGPRLRNVQRAQVGDWGRAWRLVCCPPPKCLPLSSSSLDVFASGIPRTHPGPCGPPGHWASGLWLRPEGLRGRLASGRVLLEQWGVVGAGPCLGLGSLPYLSAAKSPLHLQGGLHGSRPLSETLRMSPSNTGGEPGQHRGPGSAGGLAWASRWRVPRRDARWVLLGLGREVLTTCCVHRARPP